MFHLQDQEEPPGKGAQARVNRSRGLGLSFHSQRTDFQGLDVDPLREVH